MQHGNKEDRLNLPDARLYSKGRSGLAAFKEETRQITQFKLIFLHTDNFTVFIKNAIKPACKRNKRRVKRRVQYFNLIPAFGRRLTEILRISYSTCKSLLARMAQYNSGLPQFHLLQKSSISNQSLKGIQNLSQIPGYASTQERH